MSLFFDLLETPDKDKYKHLSNIYDHRKSDAKTRFQRSFQAMQAGQKALEQEWQQYLAWINKNIIGPPQATETYSQDELIKMGMIGIYRHKS